MEDQQPVGGTAVKYGLILALVSFGYSLILQYAGLMQNQALGYLSFAINIAFIVLAMREYKGLNNGFMSFGKGFKLGFLLSVVAGVLSSAATAAYIAFVDDSAIKIAMDTMREQFESNPQMTEEAIEMAMNMSSWAMTPAGLFLFGTLGGVIGGLIISLILSAIMKKDPVESY